MRSRGSNQHHQNPQNLSARTSTRIDPEGKKSVSASAATKATTTATNLTTRPQKFALPGTAKPKRPLEFRSALRRKQDSSPRGLSNNTNKNASIVPLVLAVILWYSLGVVSISSSKVLLTPYKPIEIDDAYLDDETEERAFFHHVGGLPPLFLTVQQLLLGSTFLRLAIHFRFLGLSKGLVTLDVLQESLGASKRGSNNNNNNDSVLRYLVNTGIFFALGFLTTNMAFGAAAPTYVETLKAAEPITSAIFAVLWGIEYLTLFEILGLLGIVGGVLLSTTGSNHSASMPKGAGSTLLVATAIVMASNLCFSLRGLYQKLFRKGASQISESQTTETTSKAKFSLDDLNLQFRMQQTGVLLLILPTIIFNGTGLWKHSIGAAQTLSTQEFCKLLQRYTLWSIGNGLAFSSYNLASTFLLTRISVVHHAALNCTRRIFAIVCTGLLFRIPISMKSAIGIGISFVGFMVFTKAKAAKNQALQLPKTNKIKKRDIPIGNGEIPSSTATSNHSETTALPQEDILFTDERTQTVPLTHTSNGTPLMPTAKTDFGTHRRANRSTTTTAASSRFPLPPGNNRSVASPFPRSPSPPPPPLPPPPPPQVLR